MKGLHMSSAVSIDNLSKTFRGKKRSVVDALTRLDLTIQEGEVFGFLGPNGAGKSTTIKILMGLINTTSGSASLMGVPVASAQCRLNVGYLPENPALYDFLTASEYLEFVGRSFRMPASLINSRSAEVLERLQLTEAAKRPVRSYSKGMVQRLALAQALLHDPDLYILDEPMSGLDPIGRSLVKDIIRELKQRGKTVFFSTHITADVEAVCDRVGIIVKGKLELLDYVEKIMQSGIVGYTVQVNGSHDLSSGFPQCVKVGDLWEYSVQKDKFNDFVAQVAANGDKIELIETRRRDLEEFFLEIVKGNDVST